MIIAAVAERAMNNLVAEYVGVGHLIAGGPGPAAHTRPGLCESLRRE
jgi:hypothetical protein